MPKKYAKKMFKKSSKKTSKKTHKKSKKSNKFGTSSKEKTVVMSDHKFVKFPYVSLTTGYAPDVTAGITGPYSNNTTGRGMLPFGTNLTTAADMFVFSPAWDITSGQLTQMHLLPANALSLVSQFFPNTYFSDKFAAKTPTGVQQWSLFYNQYICHGSAIEVTLLDCAVPGQLIVLPLTTSTSTNLNPNLYNYDAQFTAPSLISLPQDLASLITTFVGLPDDQPHAKIKLVSKTGGMDRVVIKHKILTKQMYDIKDLKDDAQNKALLPYNFAIGAPTTSTQSIEPASNPIMWVVAFVPIEQINTTADITNICNVQVKITYFCELMDRTTQSFNPVTS